MTVHKSSARLSDGRELIYFDDGPDRQRVTHVDRRHLGELHTASELRYDPFMEEWVVVASQRQGRTFLPPDDRCPLCPSTPGRSTEIPAPDYDVAVFENRFPSLTLGMPDGHEPAGAPASIDANGHRETSLGDRRQGQGRCEVLCFTSDHGASFAQLGPRRVRTVVDAWADRTEVLGACPGIEQVFCFENRGEEIGVTLGHPHGQIYGYPFVTPHTERALRAALRYRQRTGRHLADDALADELASGRRIVRHTSQWTAFVPFAARWPYEVHLYPNRRVPDLPALSEIERDDFCGVYLDVLARLEGLFQAPMPYIAAWHQAPTRVGRGLAALHLEVFSVRRAAGKLKYLAGSESGMGVWINDIVPEEAAARLRDAA